MSVPLPAGFRSRLIDADGTGIHTVVGGDGPPVLLLHGYPQTHLTGTRWRRRWPSGTPWC